MPALFFFVCFEAFCDSPNPSLADAQLKDLAENPTWTALLHLKDEKPQIEDPQFLLSYQSFSPTAELEKTVELILDAPTEAACRFPARYRFLAQHLKISTAVLDDSVKCQEFKKYRDFVPFDDIDLVFASEVLASASSMMGHSFLSVGGTNINENQVSHSISFFTEFDTFNPFRLIYDGLVGGMEGLLIVRPKSVDLKQYSQKEGRNVWSYSLNLSDEEKELIKLHIWELKDIEIEYLFQSYNCATLTLYVLSLGDPALRQHETLFVSPIDVVKAVKSSNLVDSTQVILSDEWAFNMLQLELDKGTRRHVEGVVTKGENLDLSKKSEKTQKLSKRYLDILLDQKVSEKLSQDRLNELKEINASNDSENIVFDLSRYKDPFNTQQDTVFSTRLNFHNDKRFLDLTFLPASHFLYSDNRQYFAESELKIGEVTARFDIDSNDLDLQQLTLYSLRSFVPTSAFLPELSGAFYLGYRHILNEQLELEGIFELSGGFGKTYRLHRDVLAYGILNVGAAGNRNDAFIFTDPHVGVIVNTLWDTKVILEHRASLGQFNASSVKQTSSLSLSWFGQKNYTLNLQFKSDTTDNLRINEGSISFDYHF